NERGDTMNFWDIFTGDSAGSASPQGILDYGSQNRPQYQGLFGNQPGLFGMSPQWQDFVYLMGSALKDRANGGRTESFRKALAQGQALNPRPARGPLSLAPDARQQQANEAMASANYGSTPATVSGPPRIYSVDEYQRLPLGTAYIGPDGRMRRKY